MRTTWNFHTAGQLTFGWNATMRLGEWFARRNLRRVLLITDRVLVKAGIVDRILGTLAEHRIAVEVFEEGEAEPSVRVALQAIDRARGFRPEAILGLGGGSNMDLAKITAAAYSHGGEPRHYFGWDQVPGPVLPLVCLPTTAGTGSEVSHAAVVTDTENQIKVSTLSNYLRPALAVVDPELTMTCPPKVTADSGIDALTHAIEAYTATDFDKLELAPQETSAYEGRFPLGECLAEKAISLVGEHLVTAVQDPQCRAAREGMALAATLAGIAFSNCAVALVHALEYPLGGALHCSHGAGNGLLLPFVMKFNLTVRKAAFAKIAVLLGEDVAQLNEDQAAERALSAVEKIRTAIGIPGRIRDIGGTEDQLPGFARKSFAIKRLLLVNPRQASEQDLLDILRAAY